MVVPAKRFGRFSVFGLAGLSTLDFEDVTPIVWQTPGDRGLHPAIREDYQKDARLLNIGMNHTITLDDNSYLYTTLDFSKEGIADEVFEFDLEDAGNGPDRVHRLNFDSRLAKSAYRAALTYVNKLNSRHKM